jgi:hypothetical protein
VQTAGAQFTFVWLPRMRFIRRPSFARRFPVILAYNPSDTIRHPVNHIEYIPRERYFRVFGWSSLAAQRVCFRAMITVATVFLLTVQHHYAAGVNVIVGDGPSDSVSVSPSFRSS